MRPQGGRPPGGGRPRRARWPRRGAPRRGRGTAVPPTGPPTSPRRRLRGAAARRGRGASWPATWWRCRGPDAAATSRASAPRTSPPSAVGESADALLLAPDGQARRPGAGHAAGPRTSSFSTCDGGHGDGGASPTPALQAARRRSRSSRSPGPASHCGAPGVGRSIPGRRRPGGDGGAGPSWVGSVGGVDLLGPDPATSPTGPARGAARGLGGLPDRGRRARRWTTSSTTRTIAAEAGLVERDGELHQGLLHRPGAGGPARRPGQPGGPPTCAVVVGGDDARARGSVASAARCRRARRRPGGGARRLEELGTLDLGGLVRRWPAAGRLVLRAPLGRGRRPPVEVHPAARPTRSSAEVRRPLPLARAGRSTGAGPRLRRRPAARRAPPAARR